MGKFTLKTKDADMLPAQKIVNSISPVPEYSEEPQTRNIAKDSVVKLDGNLYILKKNIPYELRFKEAPLAPPEEDEGTQEEGGAIEEEPLPPEYEFDKEATKTAIEEVLLGAGEDVIVINESHKEIEVTVPILVDLKDVKYVKKEAGAEFELFEEGTKVLDFVIEESADAGGLYCRQTAIYDENTSIYLPDSTEAINTPVDEAGDISDEMEIVKDEHGKDIVTEKKFTPENSSGEISLDFTFNAKHLEGKRVVVFEECFLLPKEDVPAEGDIDTPIGEDVDITDRILVGEHKDINDENQMVDLSEFQTGQDFPWILFAALGIMLAAGGYIFFNRRKIFVK